MDNPTITASFDARQEKLFDSPASRNRAPIAAKNDPNTSHLAASEITASGQRDAQKAKLLAWLRAQTSPLTSAEIARNGGFDRHMVARRLPDLERDGLVVRETPRVCNATGRQALTWRAR